MQRWQVIAAVAASLLAGVHADCVSQWNQCGGWWYFGEGSCCAGSVCDYQSIWYSQCIPEKAGGTLFIRWVV